MPNPDPPASGSQSFKLGERRIIEGDDFFKGLNLYKLNQPINYSTNSCIPVTENFFARRVQNIKVTAAAFLIR